jgi:hypothetical protein
MPKLKTYCGEFCEERKSRFLFYPTNELSVNPLQFFRSNSPWHDETDELLRCSQLLSRLKQRKRNGRKNDLRVKD